LTSSSHHGKPRDWNKRRSQVGLVRQQSGLNLGNELLSKAISQMPNDPTAHVRKDIKEKWVRHDQLVDAQVKADKLKQRFQGLRKSVAARAPPPAVEKPAPNLEQNTSADVSESTDGCSIYLEKSIGDISEITSHT